MTLAQLEKRVAKVERELEELKKGTNGRPIRDGKWWVATAGAFADDPGFEEMVRLGREYRESLRPKRRKRSH